MQNMSTTIRGKPAFPDNPAEYRNARTGEGETDFEYIEFVEAEGKHQLRLRPTGDVIGSFINHWEALRAAEAAERALHAIMRYQERTGNLSPLPSLSDARAIQKFKRAKAGAGI